MPTKILEINTLIPERLAIDIDGKLYEIRDKNEFGIENIVRLNSLHKEVTAIQSAEDLTEEDAVNLSTAMDKFCRLLLIDCPDEVHSKLKDHHRLAIFQVFQGAVGDSQPPATMNRKARRNIGK